jgi:hypothetical protein
MNSNNDMVPEEQGPQFEKLITLLRQADLNPPLIDPSEHEKIVTNARARLFPTDHEVSQPEHMHVPELSKLGSFPSKPNARATNPKRSIRLLHLLNMLAAVLVIATLIGSALLLFGPRSPLHNSRAGTAPYSRADTAPFRSGFPQLIILATQTSIGQTLELKISGFTPNTSVMLTHDVGQRVYTTTGDSVVTAGQDGKALVEIFVDRSYLVGWHLIVARDKNTQNTASATFLVVGANPIGSPKLALGFTSLVVNVGRNGMKSLHSLLLENVGGEGTITWSVGDLIEGGNLPALSWLKFTPSSGSFSNSATITITVDPGTLPPDTYRSDLWFSSRGSSPISFHFTMTIVPQPAPIGVASPLDLTFNATHGQSNPPPQVVLITNIGEGKL